MSQSTAHNISNQKNSQDYLRHPMQSASNTTATTSPGSRNDRLVNSDDRIQPTLVLSIVATGIMAFIGILTETLTNVLFPEFMAEFHVDTSTIQWLTTGYLLMVSLVTPLSSYLIGVRYFVYMVGFSMCFANTMTCGIAPVHPEFKADGNALFSTFQQLSGVIGTTVMSVYLGIAQSGHGQVGSASFVAATQRGAHWGFIVLALAVAGACLANFRAFVAKR